jgi:hypothetical protein
MEWQPYEGECRCGQLIYSQLGSEVESAPCRDRAIYWAADAAGRQIYRCGSHVGSFGKPHEGPRSGVGLHDRP